MPCVDLVVLDCDGVILESVNVKTIAFAESVAEYGKEAQEMLVAYHLSHGGISRVEKFKYFWRELKGREIDRENLNRLVDRFADAALDGVKKAPFVPGAVEFIKAHSREIPIYVASGAPQDELREILGLRNLNQYFKGIFGAPDVKPDILRRVMASEGVEPARTLMVGDSSTDLDAARATGTLFYGRGPFPEPLPWGEDLTGLSDFIEKGPCHGS